VARPARVSARWGKEERDRFRRAVKARDLTLKKATNAVSYLAGRKIPYSTLWDYAHVSTPDDETLIDAMILYSSFVPSETENHDQGHDRPITRRTVSVDDSADGSEFDDLVLRYVGGSDAAQFRRRLLEAYATRLESGSPMSDAEVALFQSVMASLGRPDP
jgi:hypothetical protein